MLGVAWNVFVMQLIQELEMSKKKKISTKAKVKSLKRAISKMEEKLSEIDNEVNGSPFGSFHFPFLFGGGKRKKSRIDNAFDGIERLEKKIDTLAESLGKEFVFRDDLPEMQVCGTAAKADVGEKA